MTCEKKKTEIERRLTQAILRYRRSVAEARGTLRVEMDLYNAEMQRLAGLDRPPPLPEHDGTPILAAE